ncbi:TLD domain-containing protein 2-like [Polyodon spathula]|uniref:TLD domain-containing protein 2-like n=1 Tax=Polyodon spathula TaxID=7913 RepID=UPI001B7EEE91|nr:TLD domain-containing protein 2-like [Polyodon spathula]
MLRAMHYSPLVNHLSVAPVSEEDEDDKECETCRSTGAGENSSDSSLGAENMSRPPGISNEDFCEPILTEESKVLPGKQIKQISMHFPPRLAACTWTLAYSTMNHGTSLRTLYRSMHGLDCSTFIVIKGTDDQVFVALCSSPLRVSDCFYGTGETLLFSLSPELQVFKWTSENSFFAKGNLESFAFGRGRGLFGLWLDGDIYHGRSHACDTFNNDILSKTEDFFVHVLEVWALK